MASRQELQVQKKREQETREESTIPARVFVPSADIYETQDALTVILEMPGVEKNNVDVRVEDGVLSVLGKLDLFKYQGLQPLYIEYNVGHYSRSFQLSSKVDQSKIAAELKDGVLSLTLPKVEQAKPRTIEVA
jgi:HSP20 family molecular chaperone IbpA